MNLELTTWGDGTTRLAYWDTISGADRIFILGDDGQAYEEDDDEQRRPVELVAVLRAMAKEENNAEE